MSESVDFAQLLGSLSDLEYEQQRRTLARDAGVTVGFLDRQFKATRRKDREGSGSELSFDDILPTGEHVDPEALLDDLAASIRRFVSLPDGGAEIASCWTLAAWAHDAFHVSPILNYGSPQKGSGKTTALDWEQQVVPRPLPAAHATTAAIFRAVEKWQPTLILDEGDAWLRDNEDLRGLLNSGHVRTTARVLRTVDTSNGPEVRAFSSWSPKIIAGIGKLPETLADRSVTIMLQRKRSSENVERLRIGRGEEHFRDLRQRCANFADQFAGRLRDHDPTIPSGLSNRKADNWAVLFSVADAAGQRWSDRIRAVAETAGAEDDADARTQLLADILAAFIDSGADEMATKAIIEFLVGLDEAPWSTWAKGGKPLTARHLGAMLKPYGVSSEKLRIDGKQVKGYRRAAFGEAWERYLPQAPEKKRTSVPIDDNSLFDNNLPGTCPGTGTVATRTTDDDGTGPKRTSTAQSTVKKHVNSLLNKDINAERYVGTLKNPDEGKEDAAELEIW